MNTINKLFIFGILFIFNYTYLIFEAYSSRNESIEEAIKNYDKGEYSESIRILEEYIQRQIDEGKGISSKVVYNLGSSYYKNGNKGKAMGAYLVARRLNPIDSDIKYNINFLKDSLTDSLEVESLSSWDVVFFWNFFLNKKLSLYLVALIFALLELCIFLYMIRYKRNIMKYLSIVLGVVFIVGLAGLYVKINAPVWTATVSDSVEVYSGPSDENSVLFNLHEAAPVMIEEKLDDWRKIKLSDGKTGWLKAKEVWTLLEDRG